MEENNIRLQIYNNFKINPDNEKYENYFNTNDTEELNEKLKEMVQNNHPLKHKYIVSIDDYKNLKFKYKEFINFYIEFSKYLMLDKIINRRFRYIKKNNLELNLDNIWTNNENIKWNETIENIDNFKNTLERQVMREFTQKQQMEYFNEIFNEEMNEKKNNNKMNSSEYTYTQEIENSKNLFEYNTNLNEFANKKYDIDDNFKIDKNNEILNNENLQNNYISNINKYNEINENLVGHQWNEYFKPITNISVITNINSLNTNNLTIDEIEKKRNDEINNIHNLNNYDNNGVVNSYGNDNIYFLWNQNNNNN